MSSGAALVVDTKDKNTIQTIISLFTIVFTLIPPIKYDNTAGKFRQHEQMSFSMQYISDTKHNLQATILQARLGDPLGHSVKQSAKHSVARVYS